MCYVVESIPYLNIPGRVSQSVIQSKGKGRKKAKASNKKKLQESCWNEMERKLRVRNKLVRKWYESNSTSYDLKMEDMKLMTMTSPAACQ